MTVVMKRSKAQVIRGNLPRQTFEHPNETAVRVLWTPASRAEVNKELLIEALDRHLAGWTTTDPDSGALVSRAPGFLLPAADHADQYAPVEPDGPLFYETWPLVLRCTNQACQRAVSFNSDADWLKVKGKGANPALCNLCHYPRQQFDYMLVHNCGRDAELLVPPCPDHGDKHVYLHDTRSFETATWRCRAGNCNGRVIGGMRFRACGCGEPGGFRHVTLRQDLRFITQTFSFVSFDPAPMAALRGVAGAEKVVVGSYLEFFSTDWERAVNEVGKDRADAERKWRRIEPTLEEHEKPEWRRTIFGESGGAFEDIVALVGDEDAIDAVGSDQRAQERTLIWGEAADLSVWRLERFRDAAVKGNRPGAVAVIDAAERELSERGFSDVLVVDNFPVALAGYGYTRVGRRPDTALLKPFPELRGGSAKLKGKTPIYCAATNTEAVFFELDAERVIAWLAANGKLASPVPELPDRDADGGLPRRRAAKAFMLVEQYRHPEVAELCLALQHTIAHALVRNLGERSGFGEDTMSEYLLPETLTIGLFADVHQELSLGALVALVEHRLGEWLEASAEGAEGCQFDPHCSEDEGACPACMHLAFGCEHRNENLDRGLLFGTPEGHEPVIEHGYWGWLAPLP